MTTCRYGALMTRILLGLAVLLLTAASLTACSGGGDEPADDPDAAADLRASTDDTVDGLLRELSAELGGTGSARLFFVECQMSSKSRYAGNGQVRVPADDSAGPIDPKQVVAAFERAGLEGTVDAAGDTVSATQGQVEIHVSGLTDAPTAAQRYLSIAVDSECGDFGDADWIGDQGFSDLSA